MQIAVRPNAPHGAPISYTIDEKTVPWVVRFDNGTTIEFPDYATTTTVYGVGYPEDFNSAVPTQWPLPVMIMRLALGHVTLAQIAKASGLASYWAPSTHVDNPINNSSKYDFNKALYNPNDTDELSINRQRYMIKALYELGILNDAIIESLGATAVKP